MNLQELASGYAALVEQNVALDSLLSACEGEGAANASGPCAGQDHVTYHGYDYAIVENRRPMLVRENLQTNSYSDGSPLILPITQHSTTPPINIDSYWLALQRRHDNGLPATCAQPIGTSVHCTDWQLPEDHAAANGHSERKRSPEIHLWLEHHGEWFRRFRIQRHAWRVPLQPHPSLLG